ncbi:MAG: MFS transporter [Kangiellaceae bacterium]|nr:MFS transporter [Kangiellaceae bacterium]
MKPTAQQGSNLRNHILLFSILVITNFFVGGMVGLERTLLPLIAEADFGITSSVAVLSFIATFGLTKASVNFFAGSLSDHWGRVRVLQIGWVIAIPIPLILMFADHWYWILFANFLLGVSQAMCWSMTVVMKVDIAGDKQRGLAIGLNEFAGYGGVAVIAFVTGLIATDYGLRPEPFYVGLVLVIIGLLLSTIVKDTRCHTGNNNQSMSEDCDQDTSQVNVQSSIEKPLPLYEVFKKATWNDAGLSTASIAGLVTNLKDGMLWGLLPIYLLSQDMSLAQIATIVAIYPIVWSTAQLIFGPLSDKVGRKLIIAGGMFTQAGGLFVFVIWNNYTGYIVAAGLVGLGTAMVYPTLLALVSDLSGVSWRASALGIYRFWRDLGYAIGAISTGLLADALDIPTSISVVSVLAMIAGLTVSIRVQK